MYKYVFLVCLIVEAWSSVQEGRKFSFVKNKISVDDCYRLIVVFSLRHEKAKK